MTIPTVVVLSIFVLKIKYRANHYIALLFVAAGVSLSIVNDLVVNPTENNGIDQGDKLKSFYGDIMALGGALLYSV
jgi:drug/metabolite transporter (DMT)-like permease